ncbi:MAG: N-formylglutamate amidohydrolase [Alphaproteobacteria bacterium]
MTDFFAPDEPPPFSVLNAASSVPIILLCEHASRRIPRRFGDLGIPVEHQHRHLMWDIGMGPITAMLAMRLGCTAVMANYSRIVLDVNRTLHTPTLIPEQSDDVVVPGNHDLTEEQRQERIDNLHTTFHAAADALIDSRMNRGETPIVIGMHSFTPRMATGEPRPWQAGVLWTEKEPRAARPLLDWLEARDPNWVIGDNEPYALCDDAGFSIHYHAIRRGLPGCAIEVRQDLIDTTAGIDEWTNHLTEAFTHILPIAQPGEDVA